MSELKRIKLTYKDKFLKTKEINHGHHTDLKKSGLVSIKYHAAFINDCIRFITVIVPKVVRCILPKNYLRIWKQLKIYN